MISFMNGPFVESNISNYKLKYIWNWLEESLCLLDKHYVKIALFRNKYLLQLCVCFWFFWNECFPHLRNISDPKKMKLRENNESGKIQTTKYDVCFLVSLLDRILDGKSGDDKLVWKINVIFSRLSDHLKIWYMLEIYPRQLNQIKGLRLGAIFWIKVHFI